jgi:hypothetical protein
MMLSGCIGVMWLAKRPREIVSIELLNGSHYYDVDTIKRLLRQYHRLYSLAQWRGNCVALCIWVDIDSAIYHPRVLTDRQRQCIIGVYINGYREWEVGNALGIGRDVVNRHLVRGVENIKKALISGKVH